MTCAKNKKCPEVFGNKEGLSKRDQEQLAMIYRCKPDQIALWTNDTDTTINKVTGKLHTKCVNSTKITID